MPNLLTYSLVSTQLHGITLDNAENNTTMVKALQTHIPDHRGILLQVRCFDHVLNLVSKVSYESYLSDNLSD